TNNTVTYSFANGNQTTDDGLFAIDAASGVITVNGPLDFETAPSHEVTVRATSSDGSTATSTFTIDVTDVDEFDVTAPVDVDLDANSVAEDAAVGTPVQITAFSEDADGSNNTVTYSFDNGNQTTDDGLFAIDATTGVITVNGSLDFETAPSHEVTVRATSSDGSTATSTFTIDVTDVDEFDVTAPVDVDLDANTVAEDATIGTPVQITASSEDADGSNNTVTYSFD
ncbi:MAG: cadherin repeat domain-containing protein, partial [bacterium]|nr:cadherin repeat domain-containing protein [bacterium]